MVITTTTTTTHSHSVNHWRIHIFCPLAFLSARLFSPGTSLSLKVSLSTLSFLFIFSHFENFKFLALAVVVEPV